MKNSLDEQYLTLVEDVISNGNYKKVRNGECLSVFGKTIHHNMRDGFPILTSKKVAWMPIVKELAWFLSSSTNVYDLIKNNCDIWTGDAYKNYCTKNPNSTMTIDEFRENMLESKEFAYVNGDMGPIYGGQWRRAYEYSTGRSIDQLQNAIYMLLDDPDSRRIIVNSWNVNEINDMVLPPCHYSFQFYTNEMTEHERQSIANESMILIDRVPTKKLSLLWDQRSVDLPLGLPFNIASYGLLLHIVAKITGMYPGNLVGQLGDVHIYINQLDSILKQMNQETYKLPKLVVKHELTKRMNIDYALNFDNMYNYQLEGYQSSPKIEFPLSN